MGEPGEPGWCLSTDDPSGAVKPTYGSALARPRGDVTWSKTRREGVSVRSERLRGLPKVDHRQGDIKAEGTQEAKELRPET